ncbi:MAG: O-antigen ligase family protein [Flavobacteriales bacterium]|jgi:putative inorganic carbon (HCO3(-)) transporter
MTGVSRISKSLIYLLSGCFIAVMCAGIYLEQFAVMLIPAGLLVVWAAIYHLDYLLLFVTLCTPLSINLEELEIAQVGMYLPTEPLLFGILILFLFKLLSGKSIDKRIFFHPVSYIIYAYLAWMALTCVTSEYPIVSIKFLATRLWFIASFYFIATHLFQDLRKMRLFLMLYLFTLCIVIIYTITRHAQYGFDKDSAHWVMEPLFKDHTSYGAVLAMYFPIIIGLWMQRGMNVLVRVLLSIGFFILTAGIILSYTRAAWISIIGAAAILAVMLLRIQLKHLLIGGAVIGSILLVGWDDIVMSLEQNKQESSDKLDEHVSSISNVSSDASNLERLNRWNCAIELFKERPLVGWGPGTYQFVYAPFQRAKDRTIISTNQGTGGNAHSEYLGPLSEQGVPGTLLVLALLYGISALSFRLFYALDSRNIKTLVAAAYLGLMTYFIHGVLNNYLDTDKASVPFWGFMAILVAIDLYHRKQSPQNAEHR